jgi:hypothetical protein
VKRGAGVCCEKSKYNSNGITNTRARRTYTIATTEIAVSSRRVATSATNCIETTGEVGRLGIAAIPNSSLPSCSPLSLSRLLISTNEIPVATKRLLLRPQKRPTVNCSRTPNSLSQTVAALARWHAAPTSPPCSLLLRDRMSRWIGSMDLFVREGPASVVVP